MRSSPEPPETLTVVSPSASTASMVPSAATYCSWPVAGVVADGAVERPCRARRSASRCRPRRSSGWPAASGAAAPAGAPVGRAGLPRTARRRLVGGGGCGVVGRRVARAACVGRPRDSGVGQRRARPQRRPARCRSSRPLFRRRLGGLLGGCGNRHLLALTGREGCGHQPGVAVLEAGDVADLVAQDGAQVHAAVTPAPAGGVGVDDHGCGRMPHRAPARRGPRWRTRCR